MTMPTVAGGRHSAAAMPGSRERTNSMTKNTGRRNSGFIKRRPFSGDALQFRAVQLKDQYLFSAEVVEKTKLCRTRSKISTHVLIRSKKRNPLYRLRRKADFHLNKIFSGYFICRLMPWRAQDNVHRPQHLSARPDRCASDRRR